MNEVLVAKNIHKSFPGSYALKGIDFSLREGEIHVLLGENGAGKSTLVNILAGLTRPDKGKIIYQGKKQDIISPDYANKLGITIVPQEPEIVPNLTVYENVFLKNEIYFGKTIKIPYLNRKKMKQLCEKTFDELGVLIDCKKYARNLDLAEKQFVQLARALVRHPKVIILDETTAALNTSEMQSLFRALDKLRSQKVAILYSTHKLHDIEQIADRITILKDGQYMGTKLSKGVEPDSLMHLMIGKDLKEHFPKLPVDLGDEVLRVKNLSGSTVKNISFSLFEGEILGIAGLMGSGKTNLIKTLIGLSKGKGEVFINGRQVYPLDPYKAIKEGICFIPEERDRHALFKHRSIAENISIANLKKIIDRVFIDVKKERRFAEKAANKLGIKRSAIINNIKSLSGGNKQKTVLARGLFSNSQIYILDEPTRGVDIAGKVEIYNIMNELVRNGESIIVVSSDIAELVGMCNRVMIIEDGLIKLEAKREEISQEMMYQNIFG